MPDHDDTLIEDRECAVCRRVYSRAERRAAPGWEPASEGWGCPACSRTRHRELRRQARILIERTEQPWRLVSDPSGGDPDVLEAARELLLAPGGFTRAEGVALRGAVIGREQH